MNQPPVRLPAPAKINLHLHIDGLLDNGMHILDTSFVFTEACDWLEFTPANDIQVTCSEPLLNGERNLVYRLLQAFQQRYASHQGLGVYIEKHLPAQAGLGGGSSDAATALLYANDIWRCRLDRPALIKFAAPFGADIPCFLYGQASLASGIGEQLTDYPDTLPDGTLLMAWPGSGLSTAEVFHHFDTTRHTHNCLDALTPSEAVDTMRRDPTNLGRNIGQNDLEASACELNPEVKALLHYLRQHSNRAWMSGSGSACVAMLASQQKAATLAEKLKAKGLAKWVHTGKLVCTHPLQKMIV